MIGYCRPSGAVWTKQIKPQLTSRSSIVYFLYILSFYLEKLVTYLNSPLPPQHKHNITYMCMWFSSFNDIAVPFFVQYIWLTYNHSCRREISNFKRSSSSKELVSRKEKYHALSPFINNQSIHKYTFLKTILICSGKAFVTIKRYKLALHYTEMFIFFTFYLRYIKWQSYIQELSCYL